MSFNARARGAITLDKLRTRLSCGWFLQERAPSGSLAGPSSPLGALSAATPSSTGFSERSVGKWIPVGRQDGSFTAPGLRAPGASVLPHSHPYPSL